MASRALTKIRYTLKVPKGARRTFSILEDRLNSVSQTRTQRTIKDPRIDALNASFIKGDIDRARAESEMRSLIAERYAKMKEGRRSATQTIHDFNRQTVERYFNDEVSARPLKDPPSEFNKLIRAIKLLGNQSLRTISQKECQKAVNALAGIPQRKAIAALNSLFRFIGRKDVALYAKDNEELGLEYITESEFETLVGKVGQSRPHLADLLELAFGTGARIGELMGLEEDDLLTVNGKPVIWIQRQRIRPAVRQYNAGRAERLPKGKRKRHVIPLRAKTVEAFRRWTQVPVSERERLRDVTTKMIHSAALSLWPSKVRTHAGIHMMRKSHCLVLLLKGAGVSLAAKQLGDSEAVVQKHYASFTHTDATIESLQRLVG